MDVGESTDSQEAKHLRACKCFAAFHTFKRFFIGIYTVLILAMIEAREG